MAMVEIIENSYTTKETESKWINTDNITSIEPWGREQCRINFLNNKPQLFNCSARDVVERIARA